MSFKEKDIPFLKQLAQETSDFTDRVFDYVLPLNRCGLLSTLGDFRAAIEKVIDDLEGAFWTFQDENGDIYENEFKTEKEAWMKAYDSLATFCQEELELKPGDQISRDIELIHAVYDDEGEIREIERKKTTLVYTEEASDREEHGTFHSGPGGVL